ncbi:V-ATPase V1 sector subunit E [Nowakowskiella sp. JEL0407]|nr:V-ATPase V1 sector subunit E [Nowakowskiella sp. JEL0407]
MAGRLNDSEVAQEMGKMVAFIKQEAQEKAREIKVKADEEFNIEKAKLVRQETIAIEAFYQKKTKQAEIQKKIAQSTILNKSRLKVLQARQQAITTLFNEAKDRVSKVSQDEKTYGALLRDLIVQGLYKLLDATVQVQGRKKDAALLMVAIADAKKVYEEKVGKTVEITLKENDWLPDTGAGGVVISSMEGKISINNTLEARLELIGDAPHHILKSIFLSLRYPCKLVLSCRFFLNFANDPTIRLKWVSNYIQSCSDTIKMLEERIHSSLKGEKLWVNSPNIVKRLIDNIDVCVLASRLDLDIHMFSITWAYSNGYSSATSVFIENLELKYKGLEDNPRCAEFRKLISVRVCYSLNDAIFQSDNALINKFLSSTFACKLIMECYRQPEVARYLSPLLVFPFDCSFPYVEAVLTKFPILVTINAKHRQSPIQLAVRGKNIRLVKALIAFDESDVLTECLSSRSALKEAILADDITMLELLIPKISRSETLSSLNLIQYCAQYGAVKSLSYFLTSRLNSEPVDFYSVLEQAAISNRYKVAEYLLGSCPSAVIDLKKSTRITRMLRMCGAAGAGYYTFASTLLSFGLSSCLNEHLAEGLSALQIVLWPLRMKFLELFLKNGADPGNRDGDRGRTAFHTAALHAEFYDDVHYNLEDNTRDITTARKVFAMLTTNGRGAIDFPDNEGMTPLALAVSNVNVVAVDCLLEFCAKPSCFVLEMGKFPPAILVQSSRMSDVLRIFKELLTYGLDPNVCVNDNGKQVSLLEIVRGSPHFVLSGLIENNPRYLKQSL